MTKEVMEIMPIECNIAKVTEKELIQVILSMYTRDRKALRVIGNHLADRLVARRSLLRKNRAQRERT